MKREAYIIMKYKNILFDLDGTITDSQEGIVNSVKYAVEKSGMPPLSDATLLKFIGPPLDYSFVNYAGMTPDEADVAVAYYRETYSVKGIFENTLYKGIEEVLKALSESGARVILATSKPEHFARIILEHFGLTKYFYFIAGSLLSGERKNKEDVIAYVLSCTGISEGEKLTTVMIGDRHHDIEGAHINGLKCAAVLYGYGDREEFENAGADFIIDTPHGIIDFLKEEDK